MSFQDFMVNLYDVWVPRNLITEELSGIYGNQVLADMGRIINYYNIYDNGTDFPVAAESDYVPAQLKYKKIRSLIDKEARFLFAKPPEYFVKPKEVSENNNTLCSVYQAYLDAVLKENKISNKMVKAAKDCLIGERIAIFVNFDEEHGIKITFSPSLEFVYEQDEYVTSLRLSAFLLLMTLLTKMSNASRKRNTGWRTAFATFLRVSMMVGETLWRPLLMALLQLLSIYLRLSYSMRVLQEILRDRARCKG